MMSDARFIDGDACDGDAIRYYACLLAVRRADAAAPISLSRLRFYYDIAAVCRDLIRLRSR